MFKHANTLAPSDRVRCKPQEGKTAAVQGAGTVIGSAESPHAVQVFWDDGTRSSHEISTLDVVE